jgi:putative transferase (TIGR04331 family)
MFLATTALRRFWDTDQDILFLSTGCLIRKERSTWESLNFEVMPNPWDDRGRFYDAAEYLENSYERMLDRVYKYLNSALGVSYGQRYWRIIIGPWLYHYVQAMYDRYVLLTDAFERHPGLQTYALDPQCFRVPRDMAEFTDLVCYDAYCRDRSQHGIWRLKNGLARCKSSPLRWLGGTRSSQPANSA